MIFPKWTLAAFCWSMLVIRNQTHKWKTKHTYTTSTLFAGVFLDALQQPWRTLCREADLPFPTAGFKIIIQWHVYGGVRCQKNDTSIVFLTPCQIQPAGALQPDTLQTISMQRYCCPVSSCSYTRRAWNNPSDAFSILHQIYAQGVFCVHHSHTATPKHSHCRKGTSGKIVMGTTVSRCLNRQAFSNYSYSYPDYLKAQKMILMFHIIITIW